MSHRRSTTWAVRGGAAVGFLVALWLLSELRVSVPEPEAPELSRVHVEVRRPLVAMPAPAPAAEPSPPPAPEPPEPTWEPPEEIEEIEPLDEVMFQVQIVEADGGPASGYVGLDLVDCEARYHSGNRRSGAYYVAPSGPCTVRAVRSDGLLRTYSDEVTLQLEPGFESVAELALPSERTGGIGIAFQEHPQGVQVLRVLPGTPAFEAGLQSGDIIVEVDGFDVATLTTQDFVSVMTGPEGSDIEFVLGFDADTGFTEETLTLTRQYLGG